MLFTAKNFYPSSCFISLSQTQLKESVYDWSQIEASPVRRIDDLLANFCTLRPCDCTASWKARTGQGVVDDTFQRQMFMDRVLTGSTE